MTILDLIMTYRALVKEFGKDKAKDKFFALGYNRTISLAIMIAVDDKGDLKTLPSCPE